MSNFIPRFSRGDIVSVNMGNGTNANVVILKYLRSQYYSALNAPNKIIIIDYSDEVYITSWESEEELNSGFDSGKYHV